MSSVTKKNCPYCLGEFRGVSGLSIHLSKSPSCSAQQHDNITAEEEYSTSVGNVFCHLSELASVPDKAMDIINYDTTPDKEFLLNENDFIIDSVNSNETPVFSESQLATGSVQETPQFDTNLELVYLLSSLNNGNGLSRNDQNKVLRFLRDPRVRLSDVKVSNASDIEKFLVNFEKVTFGEEVCNNPFVMTTFENLKLFRYFPVWQSIKSILVLHGKHDKEEADLVFKDAGEALKLIVHENFFKPDFVREAVTKKDLNGERLYSGPETGTPQLK